MKNRISLFLLMLFSMGFTQEITIEQVYTWAKENFPLYQQKELLKQQTKLNLNNTQKAYLPQVSVNGQATYQTDVTKIPVQIPGMSIEEMSKDQYKIVGEINQLIYDGGNIQNQREKLQLGELMQLQEVEINLYNLRQRVSDLYFGILLTEKQLAQRNLLEQNIQSALDKAEVALENGVTFRSTVNELKAELILNQQNTTEILYNKNALIAMLSELSGHPMDEQTQFVEPSSNPLAQDILRPELNMFELKKQMLDIVRNKLKQHWYPKVSAFVQGGYGRPGLNMLDNDFQLFAIGGIRFSLPLSEFYTEKNDLQKLELEAQMIDIEKESFLLNTKIQEKKQISEMEKYADLMKKDHQIIQLRKKVLKSAEAQLQNGVITSHEFINKLNAAYMSEITLALHQTQQAQAQYQQQIITGN